MAGLGLDFSLPTLLPGEVQSVAHQGSDAGLCLGWNTALPLTCYVTLGNILTPLSISFFTYGDDAIMVMVPTT